MDCRFRLLLIMLVAYHTQMAYANFLRKLIGSNCIEIETATVPRYYSCLGCVVEEAVGCVTDMRYNKSGNVRATCPMSTTFQRFEDVECCPNIDFQLYLKRPDDKKPLLTTKEDLYYIGSQYPEALRCIERAGCGESVVYTQLMEECLAVCPGIDIRTGLSVCLADFNTARPAIQISRYGMMFSFLIFFFLV
jgi:hypothetical protein